MADTVAAGMAYPDFKIEGLNLAEADLPPPLSIDASRHPMIWSANAIAAVAVEVLGPFCWASPILLFLLALFSSN